MTSAVRRGRGAGGHGRDGAPRQHVRPSGGRERTGISFHRFQMAIWTLALVLVFVRAVWTDILMPDFDATLLGLMGISSGTYLGFKFPEKPA
jgi:hypothetical protein